MKKAELEARQETPLSDADIERYLPHAPIKKYSELAKYKSLHELLPEVESFCFILVENESNRGHWIVISRPEEGVAEYFCSYGSYPDYPLKWTDKQTRIGLGEGEAHLGQLFKECPDRVVYNKIHYQREKPGVSDCGRYCIGRTLTMKKGMDLDEFYKFMMKEKFRLRAKNFDEVIVQIIP